MKCRRRFQSGPDELADAHGICWSTELLGPATWYDTANDRQVEIAATRVERSFASDVRACIEFVIHEKFMSAAFAVVAHKKKFNLDPDATCEYQQRTTARTPHALCKKP